MATPDMSARAGGTRMQHGVPTPPSDSENKHFPIEGIQDSPSPSERRKPRSISSGTQQIAQQSLSPESSAKQGRSSSASRQSNNDPSNEKGQAKRVGSRSRGSSITPTASPDPVTPSPKPPKKSPHPSRPASSLSTPSTPNEPADAGDDARQQSFKINAALEKVIRGPRKKPEPGKNYVLEAEIDGKILIKAGLTKANAFSRMTSIKTNCHPTRIKVIEPGKRRVPHVKVAEKLIHEELGCFNCRFVCKGCKVEHREYFLVDIDFARQVTARWTAFCASEPWDKDGHLHPFWVHRLNNTMDAAGGLDDHDHKSRGEVWQAFVSVSDLDRIIFNINSISSTVRERFWQWLSLVQAFYTFFRLPGQVTLMVLLSLMAIMIIERDFWGKLAPWSCAFELPTVVSQSPSKKSYGNESQDRPDDVEGEDEDEKTSEDFANRDNSDVYRAGIKEDSKSKTIKMVINGDVNDEDEPVETISGKFDRSDIDSTDKGNQNDGGVSDDDSSDIYTPTHPARKRRN